MDAIPALRPRVACSRRKRAYRPSTGDRVFAGPRARNDGQIMPNTRKRHSSGVHAKSRQVTRTRYNPEFGMTPQVVGREILGIPADAAATLTMCQIAFGVIPPPQTLPRRFTRRKIGPLETPAAAIHSSTRRFAHEGIGTVRMCLPLPTRSAIYPMVLPYFENHPFAIQQARRAADHNQSACGRIQRG